MMISISDVILISLFIEAIVGALKPLWSKDGEKLSVSEYVSMGMGILLAVSCKINMLPYVVELSYPVWVEYVFYALTGIAIGRGTNFLYDLWNKLKEWQTGKLETASVLSASIGEAQELHTTQAQEEEIDLDITHWNLEWLKSFCECNDVDTTGCENRKDYIDAIERAFSENQEK